MYVRQLFAIKGFIFLRSFKETFRIVFFSTLHRFVQGCCQAWTWWLWSGDLLHCFHCLQCRRHVWIRRYEHGVRDPSWALSCTGYRNEARSPYTNLHAFSSSKVWKGATGLAQRSCSFPLSGCYALKLEQHDDIVSMICVSCPSSGRSWNEWRSHLLMK